MPLRPGQALSAQDRAGEPSLLGLPATGGRHPSPSSPPCSPRSSSTGEPGLERSKQRWTRARWPPSTTSAALARTLDKAPSAGGPTAPCTCLAPCKDLRGASKQTEDGRRMMVAALEHPAWSSTAGRRSTPGATRSRRAPPPATSTSQAASSVDAMHASARDRACLLGRRGYVISAIKDNQETILETSRRSTSATRPGTKPSTGPWPHRAPPLCRSSTSPAPNRTARQSSRALPGAAYQERRATRSSSPASARRRGDLEPHTRSAPNAPGPRSAGPGAQPLATGFTMCATHLRRRPLPGVRAPSAAQSRLPDATWPSTTVRCDGLLPIPARGHPPLAARAGCPRTILIAHRTE